MTSTNDIRRGFLDFFEAAGHTCVASAPLIPHNDPTLMFVNAGMVPFKNVFTGLEKRPYITAASSQKCVRAGGKHNDLDNVGYTARHHTFFEMLGNFSFGDYFKEQAIVHAWTLLTRDFGLSPDKLTVTVFHTDDEAAGLWRKVAGLPEHRIIRIPTSDNFWSMGDTGPCGPCSEIFFDHGEHIAGGPPGSPDEDEDRFVEIWNLVFMQFDQVDHATRVELPRPSIDTGMGLERIAAVMQGTFDNYETDTFRALIAASGAATESATTGANKASHRIIADHLRTSGFLVADGVLPANEGRGYVLRRIMRRAMRHARLLGATEPLMHRLVPALVAEMGSAYPELVRAQPLIAETLKLEETRFRTTLDTGLRLLEDEIDRVEKGWSEAMETLALPVRQPELRDNPLAPRRELPGSVAFKLYDTFGFPYDLTEDAMKTRGYTVDRVGFDHAMAEQKRAARAAWKGSGERASDDVWFDIVERHGATEFTGYGTEDGEGKVVALVRDGVSVEQAGAGDDIVVLLNQTPFYAESGGQVGDAGTLGNINGLRAEVTNTSKPLGRLHALHTRVTSGTLAVGDVVHAALDHDRRARIRANHSATHLLHAALRERLGTHVSQKGSLVAPDRLRFDVSHGKAIGTAELAQVEADVNAHVRSNRPVTTHLMSPDEAVATGAMALFGEKYGDEVRVVFMGGADDRYSVELCGGTHVGATGEIALFKIVGEGAVGSGVRRIEALTGEAARLWLTARDDKLREAATALKTTPEEVPARLAGLLDDRRRLERELADAKKQLAVADGGAAAGPEEVGGVAFVGQILDGADPKSLRGLVDEAKTRIGSGVVAIVAVGDGRAAVAVGVTNDLVADFGAVDLVRRAVAALGGQGGGGRPDMAQGGGLDAGNAAQAIAAVRTALEERTVAV